MPRYAAEDLKRFTQEVFRREGVPEENVGIIADHLIRANLVGMDSHGMIRIHQYIELMRTGTIDGNKFYKINPRGEFEVLRDDGAVMLVTGNYNFGQVTAWKAVQQAMERAKKHGVATVACRKSGHIGRVGEYTSMIAENDMAAMIFCSIGRIVAPFGGSERRLGTNPFSVGIPTAGEFPYMLDYATCSMAEGKVRHKHLSGQKLPVGWIIDKDGRDTQTPGDLYKGGAILPFGGDQGHKGFALGLMVEMLGAMLTGTGFPGRPGYEYATSGVVMTVYDISRFTNVQAFKEGISELIADVKSSKLREGVDEILIPGELEHRNEKKNVERGIDLPGGVMEKLDAVARSLDIDMGAYLREL